MALKIKISNQDRKRTINRASIHRAAMRVFRAFKKCNALVDITFVTDKKIKGLNKNYLKRHTATDVISFVLEEGMKKGKRALVGDIYISSETAQSNAARFGVSYNEELLRYTVHGVLHLLGFGDKTVREKRWIRQREEEFLRELI